MNNIFDIYEFIRFVTDKNGKGFVTPDECSRALSVAQNESFNDYRQDDRQNNTSPAALSAFLVLGEPFATSADGLLTAPATLVDIKRIVLGSGAEYLPILQNEVTDAESSSLLPIIKYPRYFLAGNYIQLLPRKATAGTMTYLREPVDPVIGYTELNGDVIYNPAASIQIEMPKQYWPELIRRSLAFIGISLSDTEVLSLTYNSAQNAN